MQYHDGSLREWFAQQAAPPAAAPQAPPPAGIAAPPSAPLRMAFVDLQRVAAESIEGRAARDRFMQHPMDVLDGLTRRLDYALRQAMKRLATIKRTGSGSMPNLSKALGR